MNAYKDHQDPNGNTKTVFWIVWVPTNRGGNNPSVRHTSLESAHMEAQRLSRLQPDIPVYVLQAVEQHKTPKCATKVKQMVFEPRF